ncbi:MAG: Phage integrase [Acidimicrobiales bacterium]|nr:Phage integrase [Acidimicrobiales bacterium]
MFHDLRHTAATLAAASGANLKALMARIGHASAAAALRYQHVLDGQDNDIARYLDRFDWTLGADRDDPRPTVRAHDDPIDLGTFWARDQQEGVPGDPDTPSDLDFPGGDDGTRTHGPLLAKQVL